MALPQTLDPAAPLGTASPAQGDDQLRGIKQLLIDVLGVPASPSSITAQATTVSTDGNFAIGASVTFGTSAVSTLGLKVGTVPTTSPTDLVQVTGIDVDGAATAGLSVRSETGHVHHLGRLLGLQAGTQTTRRATAGGTLSAQTGSVGTDAGTSEKILFTYTLPAATLAVNGQRVRVRAIFVAAGNANNKTHRIRFGGVGGTEVITAGPFGFNATHLILDATIIRTGATTQDAWGTSWPITATFLTSSLWSQPTQTLANAIDIVVTGQNGTAAANDILCKGMIVEWSPE